MMLPICFLLLVAPSFASYGQLDSITDSLLKEVVNRMAGADMRDTLQSNFDDYGLSNEGKNFPSNSYMDYGSRSSKLQDSVFPSSVFPRRDAILDSEPSIRDEEYLAHSSSLFGHKSMQGGAGEGLQRLKPDGSVKNINVVKTDDLPSFCMPPNPCPLGYTAEDGCLEDFSNTAEFSREYQSAEDCICDSEHMFDCPGSTRENEIDALARSFDNEGLAESTLDRLMQNMEIRSEHKVVAKKFFDHKKFNPFLEGEKLPVVAKKSPKTAQH